MIGHCSDFVTVFSRCMFYGIPSKPVRNAKSVDWRGFLKRTHTAGQEYVLACCTLHPYVAFSGVVSGEHRFSVEYEVVTGDLILCWTRDRIAFFEPTDLALENSARVSPSIKYRQRLQL
jgi:hypothetical protein